MKMTIEYQPPIPPEKALGYLIKEGYRDLRKILAVARAVSGYLYAGLSEKKLEQLLQTIYDEDYHAAYKVYAISVTLFLRSFSISSDCLSFSVRIKADGD